MQPSATLIASLVYSRFPRIDFTDLVDALDTALGGTGRWDGDTRAIFTVQGARMVVGFEDHRHQPGHYGKLTLGAEATLVLSIGPGPMAQSLMEQHRHSLLSTLAERINRAFACDLMLWSETAEVFEPSRYEPLIALSCWYNADLPSWPDMALADAPLTQAGRKAPPPSIQMLTRAFHSLTLTAIADLSPVKTEQTEPSAAVAGQAVLARQAASAPLSNRSAVSPAARMALPPAELASQDRVMPLPRITFVQTQNNGPLPPLPQRLTLYVMNMVLMLVALPLGFALLVFNMVRGEDLRCSARAIAMASTLIGLAQLAGIQNAMYLV